MTTTRSFGSVAGLFLTFAGLGVGGGCSSDANGKPDGGDAAVDTRADGPAGDAAADSPATDGPSGEVKDALDLTDVMPPAMLTATVSNRREGLFELLWTAPSNGGQRANGYQV